MYLNSLQLIHRPELEEFKKETEALYEASVADF